MSKHKPETEAVMEAAGIADALGVGRFFDALVSEAVAYATGDTEDDEDES